MFKMLKIITGLAAAAAICVTALYVFSNGHVRMETASSLTAYATGVPLDLPDAEVTVTEESGLSAEQEQSTPDSYLLPYPQTSSMFSDMDMQYAYLILQQGLDRSYLKNNAVLSLENGNEVVITCWSEGASYDITEGMADNETRLGEWEDAVNTLWELDAVLSRDIKETLGTDKSVTIRMVDDVNRNAVLLNITDGRIVYNLFRDGNNPKYEVFNGD